MLEITRTIDSEMDQILPSPSYMLCISTKESGPMARRISCMDGSDSDDEDQPSYSSVQEETEN